MSEKKTSKVHETKQQAVQQARLMAQSMERTRAPIKNFYDVIKNMPLTLKMSS